MTTSDKIVISLIRKALCPKYKIDASLFVNSNWEEVMDAATVQGVLGICYESIENTPANQRPNLDCLMKWFGQVEYMKACYDAHRKAITELAQFYNEYGITMMLLKGYGLSLYWPTPNHRPVGDIDVFLLKEVLYNSKAQLLTDGIWREADQLVYEKLGIKIESNHEHHTCFSYKGIMVENHYDFINVRAHKDAQQIEDKLKELISVRGESSLNSLGFLVPSPDFNVIFLIRHLGQHFAGERVTLRQLLDWGLFLKNEGSKVDWKKIVPFLKQMGIWTFFNQTNAICEDILGIQLAGHIPPIERDEQLTQRIVEDVLHPEFSEDKPSRLIPVLRFKMKRWWFNGWKHPLIYNEWLLPLFLTLLWSHVRRIGTIKD